MSRSREERQAQQDYPPLLNAFDEVKNPDEIPSIFDFKHNFPPLMSSEFALDQKLWMQQNDFNFEGIVFNLEVEL